MTRDLSPALRELIQRRDMLSRERERRDAELATATAAEAATTADYEEAFARAFLKADGPVKERECRAKIAAITEYREMHVALGLRRSASGAIRALEKDFDSVTAAIHAYNREVKADLELAGRVT